MQESFEQPTALQALACAPGTVLHARYRITQALRLRGDDLHYAAEDLQTGKQVYLVTGYTNLRRAPGYHNELPVYYGARKYSAG